jgi:hypothetical protein
MKVGDLVYYDGKICLLAEIRNPEKDNVEYILLAREGLYNLGKYQKSCIEVISESR